MTKTIIPRGIRNNNPLNIVHCARNNWQGKSPVQTDERFVQFSTIEFGLRAAFILLDKYIRVYKLDTIRKIISRWSPDNNVKNYIDCVSDWMNSAPDLVLLPDSPSDIIPLAIAMAEFENGYSVTDTSFLLNVSHFKRAWKMLHPDYEF